MKKAKCSKVAAWILSLALALMTILPTGGMAEAKTVTAGTPVYSADDLFTKRDLNQTADLSGAQSNTVVSGQDIHITAEGVYVLSGSAQGVTVYVEADDSAKVQLVLDSLTIANTDFPCIYVKTADKVFVTLVGSSSLSVSGAFQADGETNTDGVIFSKQDLTLNGTGSLKVTSTQNGVVGKDDLKITGGTYEIQASSKCFQANDSIRVSDGTFTLTAGTDALHAENSSDDTLGYIYIGGGTFAITAKDDGIHATSVVQIDGGTLTVNANEGIEATVVQINGGSIVIQSWDDGINAAQKSSVYRALINITGGDITVTMGNGDTDGVDSNGDIVISGGTIRVTGNSTFDYDGTGQILGGTVIANGQQVTTLPNQMMGGRGGWGGQGDWGGQGGGRGGQGGGGRGGQGGGRGGWGW